MDFRLIAAGPAVKVRLIDDARRKDCDPSMPTTDPPIVDGPTPRTETKSRLISSL